MGSTMDEGQLAVQEATQGAKCLTDVAAAMGVDAVQRRSRCTGREAAAELQRLADDVAVVLRAEDPAHGQLETLAQLVEKEGRPFLLSLAWSPFALHGAPYAGAPAASDTPPTSA